jgi:hypothetical protein
MAQKTGNVAVEHKTILNSQADFIVYMLDGHADLYQIGRETLIGLLKENWKGDRRWRVVQGGEYWDYEYWDYMTLIPVSVFRGFSTEL